jgi:hypothetical protein
VTDGQVGEMGQPVSYLPPPHNPVTAKNAAGEGGILPAHGNPGPAGTYFHKKRQTQYALPGPPTIQAANRNPSRINS